jgi:hypothetical protein
LVSAPASSFTGFSGVSLFEQFVFLHFGVFVLGSPAVFSRRKVPGWPPGAAWHALLDGAPSPSVGVHVGLDGPVA